MLPALRPVRAIPLRGLVPTMPHMMRMVDRDTGNVLVFTGGYVPAVDDMRRVYPGERRYAADAGAMPSEDEDATAWLMTAYAQRIAGHRGYRLHTDPPIETWLIARSTAPDAMLSHWFRDSTDNRYRLMVHRFSVPEGESTYMGMVWPYLYQRLGIRQRRGRRGHPGADAMQLLTSLLTAYRHDHAERVATLSRTGHPFTNSKGLWAREGDCSVPDIRAAGASTTTRPSRP